MIQSTVTMRLIGHLKDENAARTFSSYLTATDIRNTVESDTGGWAIWIHSEDQLELGQKALVEFEQNPRDRKYFSALQAAEAVERDRQADAKRAVKRTYDRDRIFANANFPPVTIFLIVASILVTFKIGLNPSAADVNGLTIDDLRLVDLFNSLSGHGQFQSHIPLIPLAVRAGQYWRLITPCFMHFGPTHLFFNMYNLWFLGQMIEVRQGSLKLGIMFLVIGVLSNLGEFYLKFNSGELFFGGMSGVLYGFFGYIWLRGLSDPASGLWLPSQTVWMMIVWYFLCFTGILGNIANGVHTVGFVLGMAWGALPYLTRGFRK